MGFGEELTNLGEEMLASLQGRINFLGQNIVDVQRHKQATQKMQRRFHNEQCAMGRELRADLGTFVDDLSGTVDVLRRKFRKHQSAIHQECKTAHSNFQKVSKTMAARRRNIGQALRAAKQKAARTH